MLMKVPFCLAAAVTNTVLARTSLGLLLVPSSRSTISSSSSHLMSSEVVPAPNDSSSSNPTVVPSNEETIKSWRSRLEMSMAKSRKIRGSNYVQLATVDAANNEPRVRTVVFRGFLKTLPKDHALSKSAQCDDMSCLMKMCTDSRSQKVSENKNQPTAEIVWWFPKTSEQYRIRGRLILIGEEKDQYDQDNANSIYNDDEFRTLLIARKELWGNLSDPARESFLDPTVPGSEYSPKLHSIHSIPTGGRDEEGKIVPPPPNFLLMLLDPMFVDYLNLTGEQYRQIDQKQVPTQETQPDPTDLIVQWSKERVNP